MIEKSVPVEALSAITGDQFSDIAKDPSKGIPVLAEVNGGWALFGPYGIYESDEGVRVFSDLSQLHRRLKEWGSTGFFANASYRQFDV